MAKNKIYIPYFISNENFAPAKVFPRIFFYNGTKECDIIQVQYYATGSGLVVSDTFTAFPYFDHYSGQITTTSSLSLLFLNEEPVYGTQPPSQSLYDKYWANYINLLYDPRTRILRCNAVLPFDVYQNIELNDIVQLRSNYYHLRAVNDYNLRTGECRLELLGPLLEGAFDGKVVFDNSCESAPTITSQSFNTSTNVLTFDITGSNCCNNPNELVIKLDFTTGVCPLNWTFSGSSNAYQPISTGSFYSSEPYTGSTYNLYYITSSTAISTGSGIPASDSRWTFAKTVTPTASINDLATFNILAPSGSYLYLQARESGSGDMLQLDPRSGAGQNWTSRVARSGSSNTYNSILWAKLTPIVVAYDTVAPYTSLNAEKGHVKAWKPNTENSIIYGNNNYNVWLNGNVTASDVTASMLTTSSATYPSLADAKWQPVLATTASLNNGHAMYVRGPWLTTGTPTSSWGTTTSYESDISWPTGSYVYFKYEKAGTGSLNVDSASITTTTASIAYSSSMLRLESNFTASTTGVPSSIGLRVYLTSSAAPPATSSLEIYAQYVNGDAAIEYQVNGGGYTSLGVTGNTTCNLITTLTGLYPADNVEFQAVGGYCIGGSSVTCPGSAAGTSYNVTIGSGTNSVYLTVDSTTSC